MKSGYVEALNRKECELHFSFWELEGKKWSEGKPVQGCSWTLNSNRKMSETDSKHASVRELTDELCVCVCVCVCVY